MIPLRLFPLLLITLFLSSCTAAKTENPPNAFSTLQEVGVVFSKSAIKQQQLFKAQSAAKEGVRMMKMYRYKAALPLFQKAFEIAEKANDYAGLTTLHLQIGLCYYKEQDYARAFYHLESTWSTLKDKHPNIPQADARMKASLHELTAVLYAHLGCYQLAYEAVETAKRFCQEMTTDQEKYIAQLRKLLHHIDAKIAAQQDEDELFYDFDPDHALFRLPYAPNDFSYASIVYWCAGAVFFLGLSLFLLVLMLLQKANQKDLGEDIGYIMGGFVIGWCCLAQGLTMMAQSPQPILLTPTHLLIPFFLREDNRGFFASLFSWPSFSDTGTYYPVSYDDLEVPKLISLSRTYSTGDYSYTISYPGLSIQAQVDGANEVYVIHSQDCDMRDFSFLVFLIATYCENKLATESRLRDKKNLDPTSNSPAPSIQDVAPSQAEDRPPESL